MDNRKRPVSEPLSAAELVTLRQWLDADRFTTYTSEPEKLVRRLLATLDGDREAAVQLALAYQRKDAARRELDVDVLVQAQVAVSQRVFTSMTEKAKAVAAEYRRLIEAPSEKGARG